MTEFRQRVINTLVQSYVPIVARSESEMLKELLCIIHRDGGQRINEAGLERAFEEAKILLGQRPESFETSNPRTPSSMSEKIEWWSVGIFKGGLHKRIVVQAANCATALSQAEAKAPGWTAQSARKANNPCDS